MEMPHAFTCVKILELAGGTCIRLMSHLNIQQFNSKNFRPHPNRAPQTEDFYCRAKQGCGAQLNSVDEYWQWTTSGQHCIRCQSIESGTDQGQGFKPGPRGRLFLF